MSRVVVEGRSGEEEEEREAGNGREDREERKAAGVEGEVERGCEYPLRRACEETSHARGWFPQSVRCTLPPRGGKREEAEARK